MTWTLWVEWDEIPKGGWADWDDSIGKYFGHNIFHTRPSHRVTELMTASLIRLTASPN